MFFPHDLNHRRIDLGHADIADKAEVLNGGFRCFSDKPFDGGYAMTI